MFKVGLIEQPLHTRYSPTALVSTSYLTAVGTRIDSFRLPDYLNSLFPRSASRSKYVGLHGWPPKSTQISNRGRYWGIWPPETGWGGSDLGLG
jgi:hypothetical protein